MSLDSITQTIRGKVGDDLSGAVGTAVVRDDDSEVRVFLREKLMHTAFDAPFLIVTRHDNGQ